MNDLLTTPEAAAKLRVAPSTLAGWRSDPMRAPERGGPKFIRVGRGSRASVRYRLHDLESWVENQPAEM